MPRVEGSVESPHERQQVVRALDRLGRDVYVLGRVERHRYADGGGEVTRPQTTGEDDRLGLHVASIGADARHRPAIEELLDPDALADRGAAVMRALGEGERRVSRIHGPVAGLEEGADETVGRDQRPHLGHLGGSRSRDSVVMTGDRGRVPAPFSCPRSRRA